MSMFVHLCMYTKVKINLYFKNIFFTLILLGVVLHLSAWKVEIEKSFSALKVKPASQTLSLYVGPNSKNSENRQFGLISKGKNSKPVWLYISYLHFLLKTVSQLLVAKELAKVEKECVY